MADDSELERTEPASPRRLEQAREEGQVARSPELATFAVLVAAGGGLWVGGAHLLAGLKALMRGTFTFDREVAADPLTMLVALRAAAMDALTDFSPLLALLVLTALAAPLLVNGWLFTLKPLAPDFARLDPVRGLARMFSRHGLIELAKALAKVALVGAVAAAVLWHAKDAVLALPQRPLAAGVAEAARTVGLSFLLIAGALVLIVAIDVPFQLWKHASQLRMSREELKQETKETEGDPHVKAAIRSQQRAAARKRMMAEVPKADVIVTNPIHYAVALVYQGEKMRAPRVVAKGAHLLAAKIREVGLAHRVPVLEAPMLARALYRHTEIGGEIPEKLYTAVAEVLAYVYQLRRHREGAAPVPRPLAPPAVPPDLDPEGRAP